MWTASDIATCPFGTGLDMLAGQEVHVGHHLGDRNVHRALLQFFEPENDLEVRNALLEEGTRT
jgi:hypothetical protein